jgi:hypothetical protein
METEVNSNCLSQLKKLASLTSNYNLLIKQHNQIARTSCISKLLNYMGNYIVAYANYIRYSKKIWIGKTRSQASKSVITGYEEGSTTKWLWV